MNAPPDFKIPISSPTASSVKDDSNKALTRSNDVNEATARLS
ncbi:MAG: hypothetical protein O3C21_13695 [Verrucomicrobia bacterium]|nr:hypothetical protein [Verrucomicrobiota bacterium]